MSAKPKTKTPPAKTLIVTAGAEIRGDQILLTARKLGKPKLINRTGQHKGSEILGEKDAHARVLRGYTNVAK